MAPLSGIRIIESGVAIAGPTACRYLGHLGAEVIKVENATGGMRSIGAPPWAPADAGPIGADLAAGSNVFNSQKRSLALDMKNPEGMRIFHGLIRVSDAFISNMSLPAIESLDLGWDPLSAINPKLIHLVMPGFGTEGPYREFKSWGPNLSSFSGLDNVTGYADRQPVMTPVPLPDYFSAYLAVTAVLAALRHRDRTGAGQRIDMGQYQATLNCLGDDVGLASLGGEVPRAGNRIPWAAPRNVFSCAGDDRWVAISVSSDEQWAGFAAAAEGADWARDDRFVTVAGRKANEDELERLITGWTSSQTPREIAIRLQKYGVPAAPVNTSWDQATDPQLEARRFWKMVSHGRLGIDLINGLPMQFSDSPLDYDSAAPPLGQDSLSIVEEILGVSPSSAKELVEGNAIWDLPPLDLPTVAETPGRPWFKWGVPLIKPDFSTPAADEQPLPAATGPADTPSGSPLDGVRVLDLSDHYGAFGTRLLARLGATVVRVEPPEGAPIRLAPPIADGVSLFHQFVDAGKESVVLDLDSDDGRQDFLSLVTSADIVYEGIGQRQLKTMGLAWEQLRDVNPALVNVSVTGFGNNGPYQDWQSDDLTLWALSGMLGLTGYPDSHPVAPGRSLSAYGAGTHGAISALAGLACRERTGRGQFIEVSAHEVMMMTAGVDMPSVLDDGVQRVRAGSRALGAAPWGFFQCQDRLVSLLALFPNHWDLLAQWIHEIVGDEAVLDEKYRGGPQVRYPLVDEVTQHIESLASRYGAQDFCEESQRRGIPAAPVNSLKDALEDPHLGAIDFWTSTDVKGLGTVKWPGDAFSLSGFESPVAKLAPGLGTFQGWSQGQN